VLEINSAAKAARKAIRTLFPHGKYRLESLKNTSKIYNTWVFRCVDKINGTSVVCKLSSSDTVGREKISNQYQRLRDVGARLNSFDFSAPKVIAFLENQSALIMEDIDGQSVLQSILMLSDLGEAEEVLRMSGKWLAHFQNTTISTALFEPKSHINWLRRKLNAQDAANTIPYIDELFENFKKLELLASSVRGLPSTRCITHRDFHLGNLILGENGAVYGIDFENGKDDDALRDAISFTFDFALRCNGISSTFEEIQKPAMQFWNAYSDNSTHPMVVEFFQKFSALDAWSGANKNAKFSVHKARKVALMRELAKRPLIV
jgi:tRNA A-37 threonylcarbamoyl transferase component Bud32